MKLNRSLSGVLGVLAALVVPAAVFAQFNPNDQLTATSLNAIAANVVQVGGTATAASLASNASTGAFTTTTYRAQADGVVTLFTSGNAVSRTNINVGLEIDGAVRNVFRATGGNGVTFTVRDGQRFSVGGAATGGAPLDAGINIAWTPLTADTDPPIVSN
jgi:hypothetical protein